MALELKPTSRWWYARYRIGDGFRRFPLTRKVAGKEERIAVRGQRPDSLKTMEGADAIFMDSYHQAMAAHDQLREELRSKRTVEDLTQRLVKVRTGAKKDFVTIASVPDRWVKFQRESAIGESHKANGLAVLNRFVAFMARRWPDCKDLIDVRENQAAAFLDAEAARGISARTWNVTLGLLKSVFSKLEPSADAYTQFLRNAKSRKENTVHREPFSSEELTRILEAARKDTVLRGPVHVACFTALRKGDACCLKWDAVDLKAGIIRTRTSKTGEWVEIPVMPLLAEELSHHPKGKSEYVFPEAAKLYRDDKKRPALDKRFKDILRAAGFAKDMDKQVSSRPPLPKLTPEETRKRAASVLEGSGFQDRKREKMLEILDSYLAGATLPDIARKLKVSKSTVSLHLNTLEELCRCAIFRHRGPESKEGATEVLETSDGGERLKRGSRYGWHSFRTTFITEALSNGMPEELVRRVTGHSAVDVVRKHYYRPNQETFRREFARVADGFYQSGGEGIAEMIVKLEETLEHLDGKNWRRVKKESLAITERIKKAAGN